MCLSIGKPQPRRQPELVSPPHLTLQPSPSLSGPLPPRSKKGFIIQDLDERTLLIQPAFEPEIRAALKKYADELSFDPLELKQGAQA